ncbi:MAG: hypothetical protein Fur0037_04870 [Planctomycetota bacterium]
MKQDPKPEPLTAPSEVEQGRPFDVTVHIDGVDRILVADGSGNKPQEFPVGPGKTVTIPARPEWTAGTILFVYTSTVPVKGILVTITPQQIR